MADKTTEKENNPFTRYGWHEEKRQQILEERGIDFVAMQGILDAPHFRRFSPQNNEDRWIAVGELGGKVFTVVYTKRNKGQTRWIITARRARDNEEREYRQLHRRGDGQAEG